jgi:hypothetical protein
VYQVIQTLVEIMKGMAEPTNKHIDSNKKMTEELLRKEQQERQERHNLRRIHLLLANFQIRIVRCRLEVVNQDEPNVPNEPNVLAESND